MTARHSLLILLFSFTTIYSVLGQQTSNKSNYSLLWEVSGNGLENPSYLFGTMHVRDMRAFEFPDSLLIVFDQCEAMATEVHFDSLFTELWYSGMEERIRRELYDLDEEIILPDEIWLDDYSSDSPDFTPPPPPPPRPGSKFKAKQNTSRKGVTNSKFNLLDLLFEQSEEIELADEFLDAYLFKRAKNLEKDLFGLEEVKTQLDLRKKNRSIDTTMVDSLLVGEVPDVSIKIDELYSNQDLLVEIYQQGNLKKVREFSRIFYGQDSKDRKEWLLDRNEVMLRSMIEIMHEKTLFCAVGSAHLPDEGGLLELLRAEGYTLRKVTPTFTGMAAETMKIKLEDVWTAFRDDKAGYSLEVPKYPEKMELMAGFDSWLCGDLVNNVMIMNYGIPCAFSGLDADDPNLFDEVIQNMKDEGRIGDIKSQRKITQSGVDGMEVNFVLSTFAAKQQGKIWLFSKEQYMYVIMMLATDGENLTDDKKLLNSIRFFPRERSEDAPHLKIEAAEGFSALMPGIYDFTELFMTIDYSQPDFKSRQAQFVSSDMTDNTVRMVIKSNVPPGQYYDNDSITLASIFEDPTVPMKYGTGHGKKIKLDNGIVGFQSNKIIHEDGIALAMRAYLRGPTMYLAMFQQASNEFDMKKAIDFFQSIEFLPLKKDDMFMYNYEEVHVPLVNEPISSDFSGDMYYMGDMEFHKNDFFPSSSISFSFYKTLEPKYQVQERIDSVYKEQSEMKSWLVDLERDTILTNESGDRYLDLIIPQTGSNCVEREITFYKNGAYYKFLYLFPVELQNTPWFLDLPEQIKIDDIESSMSAEEKRNLFFEDISSGELERFSEAKDFLYQKEFELRDSTELEKLLYLNFDFADTEDSYLEHTEWMHNRAVEELLELDDEFAKPILLKYFTKETLPSVKTKTYARLKKKGWTEETLASLIQEGDSIVSYSYQFTEMFNTELKDSLDRFIDEFEIYSQTFDQDRDGLNGLLSSVVQNWDTLTDRGFSMPELILKTEKWFVNAKDSVSAAKKEDRYSWAHQNCMNLCVDVLSHCESYANHDLISSVNYQEWEISANSFLLYKMQHDLEITEEEWEYAVDYEWGLFDILLGFHKEGRSKLIPKKLRGEEELERIALKEMLMDDWGSIEITKHLGTKNAIINGEDQSLEFMLIKDEYDPELTYVACIESIDLKDLEQVDQLWNLAYDYSYNEVENGNYQVLIDEILSNYKE